MSLADSLREIVKRAFQYSHAEYEAELATVNRRLGLSGELAFRSEVRPKFFTGDPEALVPGRYLLVLSLNHKYSRKPDVEQEYERLNQSATEHFESCAHYFETGSFSFFTNFVPVLKGGVIRE